jgi:type I restriction enzyme S subunit
MRESSVGTTTKFLTMQILNVIPILIPDFTTFQHFENYLQKIFEVKILLSTENQKITEMKDLLLSKMTKVDI